MKQQEKEQRQELVREKAADTFGVVSQMMVCYYNSLPYNYTIIKYYTLNNVIGIEIEYRYSRQ